MIPQITIGAASLMGSLVVGTLAIRYAVSPAPARGRHRAPKVRAILDEVSLGELLDGGEVEANGFEYCPVEHRTTFHAFRADGSRRCWTCSGETAGGTA